MPSLSHLYFGKDDAESDAEPTGLLDGSFVRTEGYELALRGQKSLFIGRKGTGKSAICIKIHQELGRNQGACIITPDEISAEEIRKFDVLGITPLQSKRLLWRYVFTVAVAKHVLHIQRASSLVPRAPVFDKIRAFLVDNNEVDDLSFSERMWRVIQRLKMSLKISALGTDLHVEVGSESSRGLQLSAQIDLFAERVREAADLVFSANRPFLVLVDQIEKVWTGDQDSKLMVQGLLGARELGLGSGVRAVYFLRTDIYRAIRFYEGDKYHSDEFRLSWSKGRLVRLIEERARVSMARSRATRGPTDAPRPTEGQSRGARVEPTTSDREYTDDTPARGTMVSWWSDVWEAFPEAINDVALQDFLVEHTLFRPRDIIQLCNACRDTAMSNGHEVIAPVDVQKALTLYSHWKLSDLVSEWVMNYPFINDLLLVFTNSSYLLTRDRLRARSALILPDLAQRYPAWKDVLVPGAVAELLFGIGFLGILRSGSVIYSFDEESPISPQDIGFYIHPCYRIALRATSAIELAPYSTNSPRALAGHSFHGRPRGDELSAQRLERLVVQVRSALVASHLPHECKAEIAAGLNEAVDDLRGAQAGTSSLPTAFMTMRSYIKGVRERLTEGSWMADAGDRFRSGELATHLELLHVALEEIATPG